MALRESLQVSTLDPVRIETIRVLAYRVIEGIEQDSDCRDLLNELSKIARSSNFDRKYFATLHSRSSVENFATEAALPAPRRVLDLSRHELEEIVKLAKEKLI